MGVCQCEKNDVRCGKDLINKVEQQDIQKQYKQQEAAI
jgi:hypothetical protein